MTNNNINLYKAIIWVMGKNLDVNSYAYYMSCRKTEMMDESEETLALCEEYIANHPEEHCYLERKFERI